VVIEAGMELTLKAGGMFLTINPSGICMTGPVRINGGVAGNGSALRLLRPAYRYKFRSLHNCHPPNWKHSRLKRPIARSVRSARMDYAILMKLNHKMMLFNMHNLVTKNTIRKTQPVR
jgi:hypothetical protein